MLLVIALLASSAQAPCPTEAATFECRVQDRQAEYATRRKAAEGDVDKLWRLFDWCEAYGLGREGRKVLRAIIELDDSRKAHELLGEIRHDGKWFASARKVEEYKRRQLKEEAKRTGKVIYDGRLVDPDDVALLARGMVKGEDGQWLTAEDHQRLQQGWLRQDLEWVSPDEVENIDNGLYKCDDQWLSLEDANQFHSELGRWWRIPSDHYVLYTTCDRDTAERAAWEAERIYAELVRIFGRGPDGKVMLLVLGSREQYSTFAKGTDTEPVEGERALSSLHGAFVAELWSEPYTSGFGAAGVAYWNVNDDAGAAFGRTFVRHAAGQSFVEALDPSPKFAASLVSGELAPNLFWEEKALSGWFRYGAAGYVERYFLDSSNPDADGGPLAWRSWSISNLVRAGGLDPLEQVFEFSVSANTEEEIERSTKLMNEAGLLMAFIVDGDCKPVVAKHLALKSALKKKKGVQKALEALEKEIAKNESQLKKFAGI
jgi:hypothetical protein